MSIERDRLDVTIERTARASSDEQVQIAVSINVYLCNVARRV